MKICIVVGTRPEIIKMSPIIRLCHKKSYNYFVTHTGQHYSYNMDKVFFDELELPTAKYNLKVGSGTHAEETAKILQKIEYVFLQERPSIILVEGDTNTVLASALAASKLYIRVGHVEAGLRSYDRTMPEEINRVLTDHISDFLFCPTEKAKKIAVGEGIPKEKVFVTGNTIVDAVRQNIRLAKKKSMILRKLNLRKNNYFLATFHRQENVDDKTKLINILAGLEKVCNKYNPLIIYPIHPRTKKRINKFNLSVPKGLKLIEPVGFLDFLLLESNAKLVLTDSGGIQEETCILKVPCVTLRENTERPETLDVGSNILAGTNPNRILQSVGKMLNKKRDWRNPFGDGKAAERIINIIDTRFKGM